MLVLLPDVTLDDILQDPGNFMDQIIDCDTWIRKTYQVLHSLTVADHFLSSCAADLIICGQCMRDLSRLEHMSKDGR